MLPKSLLALAASFALTSASPFTLFPRTDTVPPPVCKCTAVTPSQQEIILGQSGTGAYVTYSIDANQNLIITYGNVPNYKYKEVHLYIGTTPPPTNAPGQFPYSSSPEEGHCTIAADAQTATCTVALSEIGSNFCNPPPTTFYIATHAAHLSESNPTSTSTETSWGNGPTCIKLNQQGKCAPWAVYSTFQLVCGATTPGAKECERGTAFGYPTYLGGTQYYLNTISDVSSERWGWYFSAPGNYFSSGGVITGNMHVGAGGNDLANGFKAGHFWVQIKGSNVVVTYTLVWNYDLIKTHVYASCSPPTTAAPGLYGNTEEHPGFEPKDQTYDELIPLASLPCLNSEDPVYFILHASVGEVVPASTVCSAPSP